MPDGRPATYGFVHVGLAAGAALLSLGAAEAAAAAKLFALAVGVVPGAWAGAITGRTLERGVDSRGGIVLYSSESAPYALLWPIAVVSLSPFAFGTMVRFVSHSAAAQWLLQLLVCGLAAAWLSHDIVVARRLRRLSRTYGTLTVQWFHARSVTGPEGMLGSKGVVTRASGPTGYVRIGGELWRAQSLEGAPLRVGQEITVRRLNGLTVFVEAAHPSHDR